MFPEIKMYDRDNVYTRSTHNEHKNGVYLIHPDSPTYAGALFIFTDQEVVIIHEREAVKMLVRVVAKLQPEGEQPISCREGMLMNTDDLVRIIGASNSYQNNKAKDML